MIDFLDISYLKHGNPRQQQVFELLEQTQILNKLGIFHPIIVGTVPIELDLESSDLDILCEVHNPFLFLQEVKNHLAHYPFFHQEIRKNYVTVSFTFESVPFEIFGENKSTTKQNGYLHMLIEHQLLQLFGPTFHQQVRLEKENGLKTEAAFTQVLEIQGNPYEQMLKLEQQTDIELLNQFSHLIKKWKKKQGDSSKKS